jgi:hypothetical protein
VRYSLKPILLVSSDGKPPPSATRVPLRSLFDYFAVQCDSLAPMFSFKLFPLSITMGLSDFCYPSSIVEAPALTELVIFASRISWHSFSTRLPACLSLLDPSEFYLWLCGITRRSLRLTITLPGHSCSTNAKLSFWINIILTELSSLPSVNEPCLFSRLICGGT